MLVEEVADVSSSLAEAVKQMEARLTKQFAEMMHVPAPCSSRSECPQQEYPAGRSSAQEEHVTTAVRSITTSATVHFPETLDLAASFRVEVREAAFRADSWITSYVIAQDCRTRWITYSGVTQEQPAHKETRQPRIPDRETGRVLLKLKPWADRTGSSFEGQEWSPTGPAEPVD